MIGDFPTDHHEHHHHRRAACFDLRVTVIEQHHRKHHKHQRRRKYMTYSDGQNLLITITDILDAQQQPAVLAAGEVPRWTTSDPTIFNPTPAADGMSATGTVLKPGTVTITATASVENISASTAITAGAAAAASFQLTITVQ